MKLLIVDNEELARESLGRTIRTAMPEAELLILGDPCEALEKAKEFKPDAAFLDIEMPGMSGLILARRIKEEIDPKTNIIFTTGFNEYIEEAFTKLRASGYLMKPITADMVLTELENLRYPVELKGEKRVRIRTFGAFEVFIDDIPAAFHYAKTKELIAYLVDHGGLCPVAELRNNLWEESEDQTDHRSYLQNLISDLIGVFDEHGLKEVILRKYGSVGLDTTKVDCDLYLYRQGNHAAVNAFRGEYMSQYSWAEMTLGKLYQDTEKKNGGTEDKTI